MAVMTQKSSSLYTCHFGAKHGACIVLWCSESEPLYIIYLYTLGNGDRYSLLLRCHATVMLMYVVD